MKRAIAILLPTLFLTAAYIYAWPTASVPYFAAIIVHVLGGSGAGRSSHPCTGEDSRQGGSCDKSRLVPDCVRRNARCDPDFHRHSPHRMAASLHPHRRLRGRRSLNCGGLDGASPRLRDRSAPRHCDISPLCLFPRRRCHHLRRRLLAPQSALGAQPSHRKPFNRPRLHGQRRRRTFTAHSSPVPRKRCITVKFQPPTSWSRKAASAATPTSTNSGKAPRTIFPPSTTPGIARASSTCRTWSA